MGAILRILPDIHVKLCAIWYHLCHFKNLKKHPRRSVTFSKVAGFAWIQLNLLIQFEYWKIRTTKCGARTIFTHCIHLYDGIRKSNEPIKSFFFYILKIVPNVKRWVKDICVTISSKGVLRTPTNFCDGGF